MWCQQEIKEINAFKQGIKRIKIKCKTYKFLFQTHAVLLNFLFKESLKNKKVKYHGFHKNNKQHNGFQNG